MQQNLVQAQIDRIEAQYPSSRTKREKRYYTPLGEMVVKRRVYVTPNGLIVKVDSELGLPKNKWLPTVLELACALGVSSEFPNSHLLFQKWTCIELTEKTLANQIEKCHQLKRKKKDLSEAITNLERYLSNNKNRIDYQTYLQAGLMIGSGVVESSNRRVVTQRLKQAGMHWSEFGAEGVMALRAVYLSNSNRWSYFWKEQNTMLLAS